MFRDILQRVVSETPGCVGATLMGLDGIAIDAVQADDVQGIDWEASNIELATLLGQLARIADNLDAGTLDEFSVQLGAFTAVLRPLGTSYFVSALVAPKGNFGKARYVLRVVGPQLEKELI